ncbi:MAG: hypothetical protein ACJ8C4_02310 [Gemmataceae bacterium]
MGGQRITAAGVFVSATWLAMTLAAFFYVGHFASPYPFGDEWDLIPGETAREPMPRWLWAQHNEHRLPLPKLVHWGLMHISGHDSRAGGFATAGTLSLLALGFVMTARKLRGQIDFADAFFPVALLNWGQFENYLIGFQISFALSAGLACAWLFGALRSQRLPIWTWFVPLLLALCGAHGLAYVPPLGLATLWLSRGETPLRRVTAWTLVGLSFAMIALYFRGYGRPADHPQSAGIIPSLKIATEVLALGWGWVAQMTWPISGLVALAFVGATGVLFLVIKFRGFHLVFSAPSPSLSLVPWLALAAGTVALALGIGWGRSGFGPLAGFADRYTLLAFPLVGTAFLAWVRFGGRIFSSLVPMGMFTVACLMLTQHVRTGLSEGKINAGLYESFDHDLRAGFSPTELASRHPALFPHAERFADRLRLLRDAGLARYHAMGQDEVANAK